MQDSHLHNAIMDELTCDISVTYTNSLLKPAHLDEDLMDSMSEVPGLIGALLKRIMEGRKLKYEGAHEKSPDVYMVDVDRAG